MKKLVCILILLLCTTVIGCVPDNNDAGGANLSPIIDATEFSRISKDELIDKLGKPESKEKWTNKTSKGNFKFTTYTYDIDSNHYEFIVYKDSVIRLTLYSSNYWNSTGDNFKYNDKNKLHELFGITELSKHAKVVVDNNTTYEISPVSDNVANFYISSLDTNKREFGFARVTYNTKYFD